MSAANLVPRAVGIVVDCSKRGFGRDVVVMQCKQEFVIFSTMFGMAGV